MTTIQDHLNNGKLYSVIELQKTLYARGYSVPLNDLYLALKDTGWIKLFLIRERLLDLKRQMPKAYPFDGIRNLLKFPLLVDRLEDGSRIGHKRASKKVRVRPNIANLSTPKASETLCEQTYGPTG